MYGYINQIDNPIPTGKVWDNETFRLTDCEKGHGHDEIMKNINKGDTYIDAQGSVFICVDESLFFINLFNH